MSAQLRLIVCTLVFCLQSVCVLLRAQEEKRLSFAEIKQARVFYEQADELMHTGDYRQAAANYSRAFNIIHSNKQAGFNAAKAYCLSNLNDSALKYLRKTIQAGGLFDYENEPAFRPIRWTDEFLELMEVSKLMKAQLENQYIEPLIILPEGYEEDKTYALIVLFHGFSESPASFAEVLKTSASRHACIIMACRGSVVIGKDAYAWSQSQEEYERVYDDIQHALRKYSVDKTKVLLAGYWQGGLLTYGLGVSFSELFRGLLLIDSNVPHDLLIEKMDNTNLRVYALIGTDDNESMIAQNKRVAERFGARGAAFELVTFPGRSHAFPPNRERALDKALEWLLN